MEDLVGEQRCNSSIYTMGFRYLSTDKMNGTDARPTSQEFYYVTLFHRGLFVIVRSNLTSSVNSFCRWKKDKRRQRAQSQILPIRHQTIISNDADLSSIRLIGTNFMKIQIEVKTFLSENIFKMYSQNFTIFYRGQGFRTSAIHNCYRRMQLFILYFVWNHFNSA